MNPAHDVMSDEEVRAPGEAPKDRRERNELRLRDVTPEFLALLHDAARAEGKSVKEYAVVAITRRAREYTPIFVSGGPRRGRGRGHARGELKHDPVPKANTAAPAPMATPKGRWPAGLRSDDPETKQKAAHEVWVEILKVPEEKRPAALFDLAKHLPDGARARRWHHALVLEFVAGMHAAEIDLLLPIERGDGHVDPERLEDCLNANTMGKVEREPLRRLLTCHY